MLEKEKLWLAAYINVKDYPYYGDNNNFLYEVVESLKFDESVRTIIIPIVEGETHIECIYDPTGNSNEKYQDFFKQANQYISEFNKKHNK